MSRTIQSENYVPGVSGWKLNPGGDFEINSSSIAVGSLPSDPQPITITAGAWSDYDLPANAIERYAFIGAEVAKVPAEYRDSAEFTTEDISFDRDGSDYRTTLTYVRQETHEEAKARHEKAKVAGTRLALVGGVLSISHDGVLRAKIGDLQKGEQPLPFVVVGGTTYISHAFVDGASIGLAAELEAALSSGLDSQFLTAAEKFAIKYPTEFERRLAGGVDAVLDALAGKIDETKLGQDLKEQADLLGSNLADQVKVLIRKELMPGGLLHRSR